MITRILLVLTLLLAGFQAVAAEPPAERLAGLRRGINITNWFRYPASQDPAELRTYLSDGAIGQLKAVGFTFVRLPVQPEIIAAPEALAALAVAIGRLERAGLAVVVELHPVNWHLETASSDRAKLLAAWRRLALVLRPFDLRLTFPELLNEPVFPGDPAGWGVLQHDTLVAVRSILPASTVVLTGNEWGSVAGLLALAPEADRNVVYSIHFYDPPELTALAAYRPGLDTAALARLPFPATEQARCEAAVVTTTDRPTADLMRFYCAQGWGQAKLEARLHEAAEWGRQHSAFVFAGEFGASRTLNEPARIAWLAAVRQACERTGMGWALWGYDDSMGFDVHPLMHQISLDRATLSALGMLDQIPVN